MVQSYAVLCCLIATSCTIHIISFMTRLIHQSINYIIKVCGWMDLHDIAIKLRLL